MDKPVEAYVYARLHERRENWIEDLRRARDHQARLAALQAQRQAQWEAEWRVTLVAGIVLGVLAFLSRFI